MEEENEGYEPWDDTLIMQIYYDTISSHTTMVNPHKSTSNILIKLY